MSRHAAHRDEIPGEPAKLGALESQVMHVLWEGTPLTVREIIDALGTNAAYTTIATVLSNLRKKQLVCTSKDGHTTLYDACVGREEYAARIMSHALESSGDRAASMLHFVQGMPESDLALLQQFFSARNPGSTP